METSDNLWSYELGCGTRSKYSIEENPLIFGKYFLSL